MMVCGAGSDHGKVEMASQDETCEHNGNKGNKGTQKRKRNDDAKERNAKNKDRMAWTDSESNGLRGAGERGADGDGPIKFRHS
jgi:hypothetical protein